MAFASPTGTMHNRRSYVFLGCHLALPTWVSFAL
jgi:hypothetical protein